MFTIINNCLVMANFHNNNKKYYSLYLNCNMAVKNFKDCTSIYFMGTNHLNMKYIYTLNLKLVYLKKKVLFF